MFFVYFYSLPYIYMHVYQSNCHLQVDHPVSSLILLCSFVPNMYILHHWVALLQHHLCVLHVETISFYPS